MSHKAETINKKNNHDYTISKIIVESLIIENNLQEKTHSKTGLQLRKCFLRVGIKSKLCNNYEKLTISSKTFFIRECLHSIQFPAVSDESKFPHSAYLRINYEQF